MMRLEIGSNGDRYNGGGRFRRFLSASAESSRIPCQAVNVLSDLSHNQLTHKSFMPNPHRGIDFLPVFSCPAGKSSAGVPVVSEAIEEV
jgi:hypothetical protein